LISLPDANVLLALAWAQHQHHEAAHAWFARSAAEGWTSCLLTQSAFLRLSLNPHVVHVAIDCATPRQLLVDLVAHPKHHFIDNSPSLTMALFDSIAERIGNYRQVSDAALLMVARAHDLKLVTFDQEMTRICPWPDNLEILMA
jgi:toxin-antitoxin system PIN domain toxin